SSTPRAIAPSGMARGVLVCHHRRMTPERARLIERYRGGAAELRAALAGVTDDDLDRPAPDGGWSARQVAHHVAESEATAYVRLRRLVAEDDPTIVGYDEERF